jgi:hypothetical protein
MSYVRFYGRFPLIPGLLYVNLSKSGISLSVGKRGWTITIGKHGIRFTAGLPGSGLSVSEQINYKQFRYQHGLKVKADVQDFIGERNGEKEKG